MAANAGAMSQAADHLIAALNPEQRAALQFGFDDPERRNWHYTPGPRRGVSLAEMDRPPAKAVHQLLTTVLSQAAHTRVSAISGLEDVLDDIEGGQKGRHAGDYWTALFGEPGSPVWGWRFEGHHVSVNVTVADGAIAATPCFLGANPATVSDEGGRAVSRPLAPEEDLAIAFLGCLDPAQRARAVVGSEAPPDILSGEAPDLGTVAALDEPTGLPATALRPAQMARLRNLAALYVNRLAPELAEPIVAKLEHDLPALCFTWAGGTGADLADRPHYYRLQAPTFLVEFDNRQNRANHIHSVWRDPGGDFGARLLSEEPTGVS